MKAQILEFPANGDCEQHKPTMAENAEDIVFNLSEDMAELEIMFEKYPSMLTIHSDALNWISGRLYALMFDFHKRNGDI